MSKNVITAGGGASGKSITIETSFIDYCTNVLGFTPKTSTFAGATWLQVYYHDINNGGLWTSALGDNVNETYRYSKIAFIETLNKIFGYDTSKYEYYLDFPQYTTASKPDYYYRWTQTTPPSRTSSSGTGIVKTHCFNDSYFVGIWKSNSSTIYQCSNTGWWCPIEPTSSWSGGSPWRINNAESSAHTLVLWLRINPNKKLSYTFDPAQYVCFNSTEDYWYKIYGNGWCEQGGRFGKNNGGWGYDYINYPIEFRDTTYFLQVQGNWSDPSASGVYVSKKTTKDAYVYYACNNYTVLGGQWEAHGWTNIKLEE